MVDVRKEYSADIVDAGCEELGERLGDPGEGKDWEGLGLPGE